MRITLDRTLFDVQSEAEAKNLIALLSAAFDDSYPHALLINPVYVQAGNNQEIDTWLSGRSPYEANAYRTLFATGVRAAGGVRSSSASGPRVLPALDASQPRWWNLAGSLEVRVERRPASDWGNRILTVADAIDLLREPLHLVLENTRTDFAFLGHLAGPTNAATLQVLGSLPSRMVTHGGGGGEAKRWLEALIKGAPTNEKWRRMLRAWVLFDQDSGDADARYASASALALMKACEAVVAHFGEGLSWICLRRREIESYVPDNGLRHEAPSTHASLVQQIIAWRADPLLAPHAWAFDLKNGLRGDLRPALSQADRQALKEGTLSLAAPMLKPPFNSLTPAELASLDCGFGKRLGAALLREPAPTWLADLPTEYDRGPPHPALPTPSVLDQPPRLDFIQSLFDRM